MHKLTGSMKELFRSGEGEGREGGREGDVLSMSPLSCLRAVYGNSMRTCAEDLIKFGTTMSTTEPILGEWVSCC